MEDILDRSAAIRALIVDHVGHGHTNCLGQSWHQTWIFSGALSETQPGESQQWVLSPA